MAQNLSLGNTYEVKNSLTVRPGKQGIIGIELPNTYIFRWYFRNKNNKFRPDLCALKYFSIFLGSSLYLEKNNCRKYL